MSIVERVFLDTNVLVYGNVRSSPFFETVEQRLRGLVQSGDVELWLSRQVMREFLSAMTRGVGLESPPPIEELLADVERFGKRYRVAEDGPAVTERLGRLLSTVRCAGKQIHDANIVATMLMHDVGRLLTHNVQDFQRFSSFITIEPLVA